MCSTAAGTRFYTVEEHASPAPRDPLAARPRCAYGSAAVTAAPGDGSRSEQRRSKRMANQQNTASVRPR